MALRVQSDSHTQTGKRATTAGDVGEKTGVMLWSGRRTSYGKHWYGSCSRSSVENNHKAIMTCAYERKQMRSRAPDESNPNMLKKRERRARQKRDGRRLGRDMHVYRLHRGRRRRVGGAGHECETKFSK